MIYQYLTFIFVIKMGFALDVNDSCVLNYDNSQGICKRSDQCPIVNNMLRCKKIRPTDCGFEGHLPVVCCPLNQKVENFCGEVSQRNSERISVQKCKEIKKCSGLGRKRRSPGLDYHKTVVGGTETDPGEYPHMAVIGWELADGTGYAWNCGGSLISKYWVITAAHCSFARIDTGIKRSDPTIIRLGEHNLQLRWETEIQDIEIDQIIKHPNYKPPKKYHDIALMRLKKQAILNTYVKPICLWQDTSIPSIKVTVTGWGKIGFSNRTSDFLQHADIDIVSETQCKSIYKNRLRNLSEGIINEQLCAGDLKDGKDTCQGDSGGPLQIRDPQDLCAFQLIGITSFGVGCGGKKSPAVYTRVSSYLDWIESVVWSN